MAEKFGAENWRDYIPLPICEAHEEYLALYHKAWELAFDHIRSIDGMPQNPYMDEAFCKTQIWIWDTCFMTLFCKYAREIFPGVETLNNFYKPLYENVLLPIVIPPENEPKWTGATPGEPYRVKVHIADNPPLFAWAEYENALFSGNKERIRELLCDRKVLQKHYDYLENLHERTHIDGVRSDTFWIAEKDGYLWEGGCSGMDNTPRGRIGETAPMQRPNNPDMLWLDAICQQALAANRIAKLFELIGNSEEASFWKARFEEKKAKVNVLYWDKNDRFYYDIDRNTHDFYRVMTVASFWTMTAGIATPEQADDLIVRLKDPNALGGSVPFPTLARNDADFDPTGKYWRGSVWLPTSYAALKGLAEYGRYDMAHTTGLQLLEHMYRTYTEYEPHTIWECYSPTEHKPATGPDGNGKIVRKDFCGWSALGPIAVYIEFVLGFHTVDAFERIVKWAKPKDFSGKVGIKNLRFGDIVTDIVADETTCTVNANADFILEIDGKRHAVSKGTTTISL